MSKGVIETVVGAAEIAAGIVIEVYAPGNPWGIALIASGGAMVAGGIGTLLTKQQQGLSANVRNSIQPWNVVYGQARIGGTCIFLEETGSSDKYLHAIYVLACHSSKSIDAVLFDSKRVCLDTSGNSLSFGGSTSVLASQQTVNIATISRTNGVVTVVMSGAMPLPASTAAGPALQSGDTVQIQNVTSDMTLNGQYVIQLVNATTFTYICGGSPVSISGQGQVKTTWPDYGDTVHVEMALGGQNASSPPFPGLLAGGNTGSQGLWTANHLLEGRTAIYLRLKYGGQTYASGLPAIAFLVSGKNDIYDPRTGQNGYSTNSALCIADFLAHPVWGFACSYGTEIPTASLIAAANICDEAVPLANGSQEPRYTCNGSFQTSAKRGEIVQNLLTSCAGRLTFSGGQYVVNPGAWIGAAIQMGALTPANASGSPLVSATLTVWATWTPDSTGMGSPVIDGVWGSPSIWSIDSSADKFSLNTSSLSGSLSSITYALSSSDLARLSELSVVAFIQGTTGGAVFTPNVSTLNIYDCYIQATFADASTATIRPAAYSTRAAGSPQGDGSGIFFAGIQGYVGNPANAIDADSNPPTTYATITRAYYGSLANAGYLQLFNWSFAGRAVPETSYTFPAFIAGPFQWKPKLQNRELYNGVKATYVSPLNNWQASDMPPYAQDTEHGYSAPPHTTGYYDLNLAADGNERRWYDMQLPFTISVSMAQRIAKIELLRRRQQGTGTFLFNLAMYQLTSLDVISMNLPLFGWTNKLLEVTRHRFTVQKREDNVMALGTELDLQETDPSIYSWSTSEELSPSGYQQAQPSNVTSVPAPSGVSLANSTVAGTGVSTGQVQITWTAPTDGYVLNGGQVIVQYSLDDTNWIALGTFDPSVTTAYVPNVAAGQQYWVRMAYVNAAGIQGPWTVAGPLTATGSSLRYYTTYWTSQTTVTVTHNLGTTAVLVQVQDASSVLVQPESITITNANVVTLTFGSPFTGSVVILG